MKENIISGLKNRILQILARIAPGASTLRVSLNRWRGVKIGKEVWIGYDAIIETAHPEYVTICDNASLGIRSTIIAHHRETKGVYIDEWADIGPGAIILPGVKIGKSAVVTAGSVVTKSVPDFTMVRGNPAEPIAKIGKTFTKDVTLREFVKNLRPIRKTEQD